MFFAFSIFIHNTGGGQKQKQKQRSRKEGNWHSLKVSLSTLYYKGKKKTSSRFSLLSLFDVYSSAPPATTASYLGVLTSGVGLVGPRDRSALEKASDCVLFFWGG
jgi:hypothetical protein